MKKGQESGFSYKLIKDQTYFDAQNNEKSKYECSCLRYLKELGNLPIERAKDAVCFLQRCGVSLASSAIIYNIVKVK